MRMDEIKKSVEGSKKDYAYQINTIGDYRDTWRIFRIMAEFVEGYQFLSKMEREVTILGSARLHHDDKYSVIAYELGKLLGQNGFLLFFYS